MSIAGFIIRPLYWLAGKILSIWVRPAIHPESLAELFAVPSAEVCYVLETGGLADTLVLEHACAIHGLPSPTGAFKFCDLHESSRVIVLRDMEGFVFRRPSKTGSRRLRRLVEAAEREHAELLLFPVGTYWGRAPQKERSLFKLLFTEN